MHIDSNRVTNPASLTVKQLLKACEERKKLIVQFSDPRACTPANLRVLNEACSTVGARLQVRFYGHYQSAFDAALLRSLPEVRDLAVDCLSAIENASAIYDLTMLEAFSFGVFNFDQPDFLDRIKTDHLRQLTLTANRKRNFDLSSLARARNLRVLYINGHWKNIEAIGDLSDLEAFQLSAFAKAHSLNFIRTISGLRKLTLILGGRPDIDDLASATLETLEIIRVRGLVNLGDLSRFPNLTALKVEDQLQIVRLNLQEASLERLWLTNCKNLASLDGLELQTRLREFRASGVALEMDTLLDRDWPATMRSVKLFKNSRKWNDPAAAKLAKRGLDHPEQLWI
ncbi:MAG: hypothetical protein ACKOUT_03745 [Novosphingobium sp.]